MSETVAHPKWDDVLDKGGEPPTEAQKVALDAYLKIFTLAPRRDDGTELCPHCYNHASITWGLTNGEANCINCGWPYRVYHRNVGEETDGTRFFSCGLPYHPSCVDSTAERSEK